MTLPVTAPPQEAQLLHRQERVRVLWATKDLTSVPQTEASRFWGKCKTSGQPAVTSERPYLRFGAHVFTLSDRLG